MPCAATRWAAWRERAAHGWYMAAFTPRCFPEEALERGEAHAVVKGDGDIAWGKVVTDCLAGTPRKGV